MRFTVRHRGSIVASYEVDGTLKRGDAHELASEFARRREGATVSRVDDDGTEKLCSTFSKAVLHADRGREAEGIARKLAMRGAA